jgi:hypothetical protein
MGAGDPGAGGRVVAHDHLRRVTPRDDRVVVLVGPHLREGPLRHDRVQQGQVAQGVGVVVDPRPPQLVVALLLAAEPDPDGLQALVRRVADDAAPVVREVRVPAREVLLEGVRGIPEPELPVVRLGQRVDAVGVAAVVVLTVTELLHQLLEDGDGLHGGDRHSPS